jgi:hypothetical protein
MAVKIVEALLNWTPKVIGTSILIVILIESWQIIDSDELTFKILERFD